MVPLSINAGTLFKAYYLWGKMNTRVFHKFDQRFCFKGYYDATIKLVKGMILRNKLKMDRYANAFDCYINISKI